MDGINLVVMNGTAYVWNAEGLICVAVILSLGFTYIRVHKSFQLILDWMKIRSLRILGNFIGSLAALPRQYQLAGLPLSLLKEETTILVEKGYAVTKLIPNLSKAPDENVQKRSAEALEELFSQQTELMKEKRKQEIESKIEVILEGKKAKRRCLEEAPKLDRESVLEEELKKIVSVKSTGLATQICTGDPWIEDKDYQDCPWNYPTNEKESLHYLIFKDLWEKGYYITLGGKFGGHYLVYPGDPAKFHALFIVICVDQCDKISMNEIVTYGRLGQSVRKTVVMAYIHKDEVCYQSVQWCGF